MLTWWKTNIHYSELLLKGPANIEVDGINLQYHGS